MSSVQIVPSAPTCIDSQSMVRLAGLIDSKSRIVVLTGAGCSTESGIPDYRSPGGSWKRHRPVQFGEFVRHRERRRRYWARSFVGWRRFASAKPNAAHESLAELERTGRMIGLVTQNVDELHLRAGSTTVIELHGSNHRVICLECGATWSREEHQARLSSLNPDWSETAQEIAPDGDARLAEEREAGFVVADCPFCLGPVKPDVVFFGESVPRERVEMAMSWTEQADLLLVVGSSLHVWSGYRFARAANQNGTPVAAVNIGPTRADEFLVAKVEARCSEVLEQLIRA